MSPDPMEDIARGLVDYEKRLSRLERLDQVFTIYAAENVINEAGRDVDLRVESGGNANMLVVDGGLNAVGVGRAPTSILYVYSAINIPSPPVIGSVVPFKIEGGGGIGMLFDGNQIETVNTSLYVNHRATGGTGHNIHVCNGGGVFISYNLVRPDAAASASLGDAANYWNDVSYKTLTDRGCLGWYEDGVELLDGSIVSDVEALKSIKKHKDLLTVAGAPRLDYSTMPKHVYKPAPYAEENVYEDVGPDPEDKYILQFKKGEKMGDDGAETTALISIMLGAIKELDARLEILE